MAKNTEDNSPDRATPEKLATLDWEAELARHGRWLRTVVLARLGESQAVDEVTQEIALAAVRQKAPIAEASKVAPWLYRLAVRQVLLFRRKAGRRRQLEKRFAEQETPSESNSKTSDPLDWLLAEEQRELVQRAMRQLDTRDAEILLLKYTEDWSYQQIADHLGVSHSAVESRLHRARAKMRRVLESRETKKESKDRSSKVLRI